MSEDEGGMELSKDAIWRQIDNTYDNMAHNVASVSGRLMELFSKNVDGGIDQIYREYEIRRKREYGKDASLIDAIAGGPNEGVVAPIYNAVGHFYPRLKQEHRSKALREIFRIMDHQNYFGVQQAHTSYIREPLLLADICTAVPLYWPGLYEGKNLVKSYETFDKIREETMTADGLFRPEAIKSDFLVAYSFLRTDTSNFWEDYLRVANRSFVGRTLMGVVELVFAFSKEPVEKDMETIKKFLPKQVHELIDPMRKSLDLEYLRPFVVYLRGIEKSSSSRPDKI